MSHASPELLRERVERWSVQRDEESCWDWVGFAHPKGYGHLTVKGKLFKSHRASYEAYNGPIPEGLQVLHQCDNPGCVNPNHLFLGTHLDNMKDKAKKMRAPAMVGELNPYHLLSEADVREILRLRRMGERGVDVAKQFNVSQCTVSAIVTGRNWSHISTEGTQ